ncbi:hypothetical protein [Chryseobacterium camelliae]|uniref:hypothetical protein n=1 Tax=Chryseobacterium camelliae TaxID=1265445 RepID=UPI00285B8B54|nr:hypothetical protein [Chryseobacterium camelliae]MDR6517072.1 hypothetical protein [Chryseobacterium camelliae]
MRKIVFTFFILISNFFTSQNLSSNIITYYEIDFCSSPQKLILQEKKNNKYSGFIYTCLEKKKKNSLKKIEKKTKISIRQAQKIILDLEKAEIDSVNKTYDDDSLAYLDGDYLSISLLKNNKIEKYSFDEIYPISSKKIEKTPLRSKIQNWLTIIDNELNLKDQFSRMIKKLAKGTYCYNSGMSTICFKKK